MGYRFLALCSANRDLIVEMDRMANPGETLRGRHYGFAIGGKGTNAAVAVARQGARVSAIATLGDDDNGRAVMQAYQKEGVDTRGVRFTDRAQTGFAVCTVESDGNSRIIVMPGANELIDFSAAPPAVLDDAYDAFMTQFEVPFPAVVEGCRWAKARGITSVIDAGPALAGLELEALEGVTIFSPNETETRILTGMGTQDGYACLEAARALYLRVHPRFVVLKLGARGSFVYDGGDVAQLVPAYAVEAVDPTAAGDAYTGALALKYLETGDILTAARYASAAGALAATRLGAMPSLPTGDEIAAFIAARA